MLRGLIRALAPLVVISIPATAGTLDFTLDQNGIFLSPPGGPEQAGVCTNQDGNPFYCVILTGEISTDDTTQNYYLDGLDIVMDPSNPDGGADVNDNTPLNASNGNAYFLNVTDDIILGPPPFGEPAYTGGIFEIDVADNTPYGVYDGTATLYYSDDNGDCGACTVSESFEVVVNPEPGAWVLAASGLAGLAFSRRRLARRSK